jgi:hypothetical protein
MVGMALSPDDKFIITWSETRVDMWSLGGMTYERALGNCHDINGLVISNDNKKMYQFTKAGWMKEVCLVENKVIEGYANHKRDISS